MKALIGVVLAFLIGFACRTFSIPSPAPPVIVGALLVVAMTCGFKAVDRLMRRPASQALNCAGPTGLSAGALSRMDAGNANVPEVPLPSSTRRLIAADAFRFVALLGLCAAYLQGGVVKLIDFGGATTEAEHFGLPFAPFVAAATITTELAASALILSGVYRWLGALWLAAFTLIATFVANRFWELPMPDRFMVENAFFEHLGLTGGFLLVALYDLRERAVAATKRAGVEVRQPV